MNLGNGRDRSLRSHYSIIMMYLCIQTLSRNTQIFLCDGQGDVLKMKTFPRGQAQYGLELKAVDELLKDSEKPDGIIVMKGMGSYTGTRIGVSIANALAFGWQKPVAGLLTENFVGDEEGCEFKERIGEFLKNPKWGKMVEPVYFKEPLITLKK